MNMDQIKGKWEQMKGNVKSTFGDLTDNEIMEIQGEREKFIGKVQERYGLAKEDAERRVDDFLKKY